MKTTSSARNGRGGRLRRPRPAVWLLALLAIGLGGGCASNSRALNGQGVALYRQGNLDSAQASFQHALVNEPNNPHILYNLARVHHQRGMQAQNPQELQQAESYYHLCLDRDGNHRECYRSLAVLLVEQDRSEQAFKLLEGWTMRSPTVADARVEQARLYEEFGEANTAKEKLLQAIQIEPSHSQALAALGRIREQQGDLAQAMQDYQQSLFHDRNQPELAARVAAMRSQGLQVASPQLTPASPRGAVRQTPLFR